LSVFVVFSVTIDLEVNTKRDIGFKRVLLGSDTLDMRNRKYWKIGGDGKMLMEFIRSRAPLDHWILGGLVTLGPQRHEYHPQP
jgi:hypothetical protein